LKTEGSKVPGSVLGVLAMPGIHLNPKTNPERGTGNPEWGAFEPFIETFCRLSYHINAHGAGIAAGPANQEV
jgi:hypothetical protein